MARTANPNLSPLDPCPIANFLRNREENCRTRIRQCPSVAVGLAFAANELRLTLWDHAASCDLCQAHERASNPIPTIPHVSESRGEVRL